MFCSDIHSKIISILPYDLKFLARLVPKRKLHFFDAIMRRLEIFDLPMFDC